MKSLEKGSLLGRREGDVLRPHSALPVSRWNRVSLPDSFDVHVPSHETAVTLDKLLGLSVVASR